MCTSCLEADQRLQMWTFSKASGGYELRLKINVVWVFVEFSFEFYQKEKKSSFAITLGEIFCRFGAERNCVCATSPVSVDTICPSSVAVRWVIVFKFWMDLSRLRERDLCILRRLNNVRNYSFCSGISAIPSKPPCSLAEGSLSCCCRLWFLREYLKRFLASCAVVWNTSVPARCGIVLSVNPASALVRVCCLASSVLRLWRFLRIWQWYVTYGCVIILCWVFGLLFGWFLSSLVSFM